MRTPSMSKTKAEGPADVPGVYKHRLCSKALGKGSAVLNALVNLLSDLHIETADLTNQQYKNCHSLRELNRGI